MGIAKRLKEQNNKTFIVALEPSETPLLTTGTIKKQHQIEGIGDDFIPELVDKTLLDDIYLIHDEDAINMSRLLGKN